MSIKLRHIISGREFQTGRDPKDLNKVFGEFQNDLSPMLNRLSNAEKTKYIKALFDLTILLEKPTENYNDIRRFINNCDFEFPMGYFFLAAIKEIKTNRVKRAIPGLFNENDGQRFSDFISAIQSYLSSILMHLKGEKKEVVDGPQSVLTISDLFDSDELYQRQIEILKSTEPPMLDSKGICKVKERERSAWAAWIYVINHRQYINSSRVKNEEQWSLLLKNAFNAKVSPTTLKKNTTTAYKKYKGLLLKLIH